MNLFLFAYLIQPGPLGGIGTAPPSGARDAKRKTRRRQRTLTASSQSVFILPCHLLLGEHSRALGGVVIWYRYGCGLAEVALCPLGPQPSSGLAAEIPAGLRQIVSPLQTSEQQEPVMWQEYLASCRSVTGPRVAFL